jgi:hypothetical protein
MPWPVRAPYVGNAERGELSSPGLSGATIDVDDDAQWVGMEAALGVKLSRELRCRIENLILSERLQYQNPRIPTADVTKAIRTLYREPLPTDRLKRRLAKSRLDAASRLALIHLETNDWSPSVRNISQFAKGRLPDPKLGKRPTDRSQRDLIEILAKVFEVATGTELSKTGFSRTVDARTIPTVVEGKVQDVRYPAGAEYGPFLDFIWEVLRFVPEAPPLPGWRLAELVKADREKVRNKNGT